MNTMHDHDGDCNALVAQLWDYLDGELSPDRVRSLEAHLVQCAQCAGHVAFERTVHVAIRQARSDDVDAERLGSRVRGALLAAGLSDPR